MSKIVGSTWFLLQIILQFSGSVVLFYWSVAKVYVPKILQKKFCKISLNLPVFESVLSLDLKV